MNSNTWLERPDKTLATIISPVVSLTENKDVDSGSAPLMEYLVYWEVNSERIKVIHL